MTDVLIAGAGPTGLVLALWLTKQGRSVRIIDKSAGPGETSRAMAVQARTLELYRQLDMADDVVAAGHRNPGINMWADGKRRAHLSLGDAGSHISPYPFALIFPQDQHERLLLAKLEAMGVAVERETELVAFEDAGAVVAATLRKAGGGEETVQAAYLAGADGARSFVRGQIGAKFEGGTYRQIFYVADVGYSGVDTHGEIQVAFDGPDFVLLMPYGPSNQARLIGTVADERAEHAETLTFADISHQAIDGMGLKVEAVNWFSTYHAHHRVTDRFRSGRVFLLGDAAHVHSPVGGQGMNTGIADAINLAWKLTAVLEGQAPGSLLDTYGVERQAFARKLVKTTDRMFSFVTADSGFANFVRTRIAPNVASLGFRFDATRETLFRLISQTALEYHASALSSGAAGKVQGGDRLPWGVANGEDNYDSLRHIGWQAHVYGEASAALTEWCAAHDLPLREYPYGEAHREAGLARRAVYLLRPDSYVALADPTGAPRAIVDYLAERGLSL